MARLPGFDPSYNCSTNTLNDKDTEPIAKDKIEKGLAAATKGTIAGVYHKTRHGFDLLGKIDPSKVCMLSAHAEKLRVTLDDVLPDR